MKVVAFLQNMWVRNPEKVKASLARCLERNGVAEAAKYRRRMVAYALFAGCLTGRRLRAALGQEWCDRIIWEEASPEILGDSRTAPPPDRAHVRSVFMEHRPTVVICFSKPAWPVIQAEGQGFMHGKGQGPIERVQLMLSPHPACRAKDVMFKLGEVRTKLEGMLYAKDIDGFYHPRRNSFGTETVGYICEHHTLTGEFRIVNGTCAHMDLTGWQKNYETALGILRAWEKKAWGL